VEGCASGCRDHRRTGSRPRQLNATSGQIRPAVDCAPADGHPTAVPAHVGSLDPQGQQRSRTFSFPRSSDRNRVVYTKKPRDGTIRNLRISREQNHVPRSRSASTPPLLKSRKRGEQAVRRRTPVRGGMSTSDPATPCTARFPLAGGVRTIVRRPYGSDAVQRGPGPSSHLDLPRSCWSRAQPPILGSAPDWFRGLPPGVTQP
jgi:hypothetical protein